MPVAVLLASCHTVASWDPLNLNSCTYSALSSPEEAEAWKEHMHCVRCPGHLLPKGSQGMICPGRALCRVSLDPDVL